VIDTVLGLPVHPLIVHAVVVLLPLTAIAVVVGVLRPPWRPVASTLALIGAAASALSAVLAAQSGEALSARVGLPVAHVEWGERVAPASIALLVVVAGWWWVVHRARRTGSRSTGRLADVLGVGSCVLAAVAVVLSVLAGHSGASAVWADRIAPAAAAPAVPATAGFTLADVTAAAADGDCWVVIGDGVYDLANWRDERPGGPLMIDAMCGTDGTDAFASQHSGQADPAAALARYRIGDLASE